MKGLNNGSKICHTTHQSGDLNSDIEDLVWFKKEPAVICEITDSLNFDDHTRSSLHASRKGLGGFNYEDNYSYYTS